MIISLNTNVDIQSKCDNSRKHKYTQYSYYVIKSVKTYVDNTVTIRS